MSGTSSSMPAPPVKNHPTGRKRGPKPRPYPTERERAILDLRAQGLQWHQVAAELGITVDACKGVAMRAKQRRDGAA